MILDEHYLIAAIFFVLLTFIAFGIMDSVIKMAFEKGEQVEPARLSWAKYIPQITLVILAMTLCFTLNDKIYNFINEAVKCIY